jgi:hypothetical protein
MKTRSPSTSLLAAASLLALAGTLAAAPPPKNLDGPKNPEWLQESMKTRDQRIEWYKEAKFGMFVHWGVWSRLGGVWKGEAVQGYSEHIMRSKKIPLNVYGREVAAKFNPVQFDADAWIRLCKEAGMRYFVITSKHHDGFAMWPSKVNKWNIADATPFQRDPLAELGTACKKYGIHYGFYYSQAQDWSHPGGQRNTWDFPGNPTSRNPPWYKDPKFAAHIARSEEYIVEKSIPQLLELLDRYHPEIIWFDTASWVPLYQNKMVVESLRKVAPDTVINSRAGYGLGDYQSTTDQPDDFQPYYRKYDVWEGIPTTNLSYGYHSRDKSHKPASFFIVLLAKAAEKGGNLLMNIGPMGDGRIAPEDVAILKGIGRWMKVNGESIYGTTHTPLPPQPWGHVTRKGKRLYLHVTRWPAMGEIEVGGLATPVAKAFLLGDPDKKPLAVAKTGDADWSVAGPATAPDPVNTVIVLECAGDPVGKDLPILVSTKIPCQRLHVFEGTLKGLKWGQGNPAENMAHGWDKNHEDAQVSWKIRVRDAGDFDLSLAYLALDGTHGGTYKVTLGGKSFTGKVKTQPVPAHRKLVKYPEHPLGTIHLDPGTYTLAITAQSITALELMAPQAVFVRPK